MCNSILEPYEAYFKEKTSAFIFPHDGSMLNMEEYQIIKTKYNRRINKFIEETYQPTCFLRAVVYEDEITYINQNSEYINTVIKTNNESNIIVFLIKKGLQIEKLPFQYFEMEREYSNHNLRNWFDNEKEFLEFCTGNFNTDSILRNIQFARKEENKQLDIINSRYHLFLKLLDTNLENKLPKQLVIYGAGNIGKQFYLRAKNTSEILYFIDKNKVGK